MIQATIGSPDTAAIEVAIEEPVDPRWVHGHFRLHVSEGTIGDFDDFVTLRAAANWWRALGSDRPRRWDPELDGLEASDVFGRLWDCVYSQRGCDLPNVFSRYDVSHLGMSAWDPYVVMLVEPPGKGQWLLWRREHYDDVIHEAHLPSNTLESIGEDFANLIDRRAAHESGGNGSP